MELGLKGVTLVGVIGRKGEDVRDGGEGLGGEAAEVAVANLLKGLPGLAAHLLLDFLAELFLGVVAEVNVLDDGQQLRERVGGNGVGLLILLGGITIGNVVGGYVEDGHHEDFLVGSGLGLIGEQVFDDGDVLADGSAVLAQGSTEEQQSADVMVLGAIVELHVADEVEVVEVLVVGVIPHPYPSP